MSSKELSRVEILGRVIDQRLSQRRAAELLDLTPRQIRRLLGAFRARGAAGLVSRRRGKPSNRKLPDRLRARVLAIVRERYLDFGPTLTREKLQEAHGIVQIGGCDHAWFKLRHQRVRVYEREDGTVTLKHKTATLPYGKFDKDQRVRQADVVDNKHLGGALAFAQRLQKERDANLMKSRALTNREKQRVRHKQDACRAVAEPSGSDAADARRARD